MGIPRTGKYLAYATTDYLRMAFSMAQRMPTLVVAERRSDSDARIEGEHLQTEVARMIDRACVAAGLPELTKDGDGYVVHYGLDFENGEVLVWDGKP